MLDDDLMVQVFQPLLTARQQNELRITRCQFESQTPANAATGTSNQNNFVFEIVHRD